jgi:hypothetical protein
MYIVNEKKVITAEFKQAIKTMTSNKNVILLDLSNDMLLITNYSVNYVRCKLDFSLLKTIG